MSYAWWTAFYSTDCTNSFLIHWYSNTTNTNVDRIVKFINA